MCKILFIRLEVLDTIQLSDQNLNLLQSICKSHQLVFFAKVSIIVQPTHLFQPNWSPCCYIYSIYILFHSCKVLDRCLIKPRVLWLISNPSDLQVWVISLIFLSNNLLNVVSKSTADRTRASLVISVGCLKICNRLVWTEENLFVVKCRTFTISGQLIAKFPLGHDEPITYPAVYLDIGGHIVQPRTWSHFIGILGGERDNLQLFFDPTLQEHPDRCPKFRDRQRYSSLAAFR
jgi:hypothetical protein